MNQTVGYLTHSKFYSPAFNAAIFDGPVRIYFAQYQEMLALKIYFHVQQKTKDLYQKAKVAYKHKGTNIFIMLYPSEETFHLSFDNLSKDTKFAMGHLGDDFVIGINGPFEDSEFEGLAEQLRLIVDQLNINAPLPEPIVEASL